MPVPEPPAREGDDIKTPQVDLTDYLAVRETHADHELPHRALATCHFAWRAMCEVGLVAVHDPRTDQTVVDRQQSLLTRYLGRPAWMKWADEPDDGNHQVGMTPPYTEVALRNQVWRETLTPENKPGEMVTRDPKWRWMHPVGPRPPLAEQGQWAHLNRAPVVPSGFNPELWLGTLNEAGEMMLGTTFILLEMLALGAGLPRESFVFTCTNGTHLLAPTGVNLSEYCQPGMVMAEVHNDLGFITGHFQPNVPGCLNAWTRGGRKFRVSVPRGFMLYQAAQELEHTTGGQVLAGMHEVVVGEGLEELRRQAHREERDLWRVTTTVFFHAASLNPVGPRAHFRTEEALASYPDMTGGEHLDEGIRKIGLSQAHV